MRKDGQNCTTPLNWDRVGIERQYVGIHPKSVGIHPIYPNFMPSQTPTIHPKDLFDISIVLYQKKNSVSFQIEH